MVCFFCLNVGQLFSQIVLEINIKDCRGEQVLGWFKFKVYRNNVFINSYETTIENPQRLYLLRKGNYRIEYKTLFGKTEQVVVYIKEEKKYSVELCLEYLDYEKESYLPIISKLNNGEQYTIYYSLQRGLFLDERTILIRKQSEQYFASIGEKEMELNKEQIECIKHFEIELNNMNFQDCTNMDVYKLIYQDKVIKFIDSSCWWYGGYFLVKKLGWNK